MILRDYIDRAAAQWGTETAVQYMDRQNNLVKKSFLDLRQDSLAVAGHLAAAGYRGEHIALLGANSYEWMVTFYGIVMSANIAVLLNYNLSASELAALLHSGDASVLIYHHDMHQTAKRISDARAEPIKLICMNDCVYFSETGKPETQIFETAAGAGDACCAILFTSGSTGGSKGVMLSQNSLLADVNASLERSGRTHDNCRMLNLLPMFHIFSLSTEVLWCAVGGISLALNSTLPEVMENARRFKATHIHMVPMMAEFVLTHLERAAAERPERPKRVIADEIMGRDMRRWVMGGAYLDPDIRRRLGDFEIEAYCGYGMTETACVITTEEGSPFRENSVGRVLDCCDIRIQSGEICVSGVNLMLGYYKDPEGTAEILKDGWILTGDIGWLDDERYLYITGKKKNVMITSSGENVSPEELEGKLMSDSLVREAIVFQEKNRIVAEIYPDPDCRTELGEKAVFEQIAGLVASVNAANPPFKHLHEFRLRDTEIEKTDTMKIKRENYYYR